ncbi:hypothetical protein BH18GEM1_BH18GEM1_01390 [soil metagenome]
MPRSSAASHAVGIVATTLLLAAAPVSGQGLRTVPPGDRVDRLVDALLLRNPALGRHVWYGRRPWREWEIDSLVAAAERDIGSPSAAGGTEGRELERGWLALLQDEPESAEEATTVDYHNVLSARYHGEIREDDASFEPAFRPPTFGADQGFPEHRGLLQHDFAVQVLERLVLGWRYVVDTNIRNDPSRRTLLGIRGTDAAFEVLDAYAAGRAGPFHFTVGRQAISLGPGRAASPLISDSIPALDQVRGEIHADPVRFTALVATLSRERPNRLLDLAGNTIPGSTPSDSAPVPFDVARFLYLHRVDWRVVDELQVAISEAAVVTGVDRGVELRFANPFIPFYLTQQEGDEADAENVNVILNLEGVYTGLGKSRLYGDVYVQEFFIDADKREEIGNQLAWRAGAEWADPLGWTGGTVGAEYTRADVFTYLHRGLNTNWTTFGVPIGSMIGPDADQLLAWADWWVAPTAVLTVDLLARRDGERSVATLESVLDAGHPDFPSGVVQREWRLGAEIWGLAPRWGVEGRARVGRRTVENIRHEAGRDRSFWEASFEIAYRLRWQ